MQHERRWWAVIALGLSIFLMTIDMTIVALALPIMAQQFRLSESVISAVTLSYSIPMTLLILPIGGILNRYRPLTTFLVAVCGFALGSVICGLAQDFVVLLIGRVVQGCFGAVIMTQGVAVVASVVEPTERGRAMGILGTLAPLGSVMGPGLGGLLIAQWGWPSVFFLSVPICIIAILLGLYSLRGVTAGERRNGFSHMGTLLHHPLFLPALLAQLCFSTAGGALYYLLPFNLSSIQHFESSLAGVIMLCQPLGMAIMGPIGGFLTDRYGVRPVILSSGILTLLGLLTLTLTIGQETAIPDLIWRLLLTGIGMGLFTAPNQTLLMSAGPKEAMGAASALTGMGRNIGFILGPLMIGILWSFIASPPTQMIGGMLALGSFSLLNALLAWLSVQRRP